MKASRSLRLAAPVLAAGFALLHAARAAALFDVGTEAILAHLLGNSLKQLATAKDTLGQLFESNAALRQLAEDRRAADAGARSFQGFAARRFGDGYAGEAAAAPPDRETLRRGALALSGATDGAWARLDAACAGPAGTGCAAGRTPRAADVRDALASTFGVPGGAGREIRAVDGEVAAAIEGDLLESRSAAAKGSRLADLVGRCNAQPASGGDGAARAQAEQCALASELSQVLHLEEGQRANATLSEIARLQALGLEQRNADLKRELVERDARRSALATGIGYLSQSRVSIRAGGPALGEAP